MTETTELALKLDMLVTLVHELSHNKDNVQRVARGLWRTDSTDKSEAYADKLTRVLFDSVVIPYVQQKYGPSSE